LSYAFLNQVAHKFGLAHFILLKKAADAAIRLCAVTRLACSGRLSSSGTIIGASSRVSNGQLGDIRRDPPPRLIAGEPGRNEATSGNQGMIVVLS
jgi:hypothetical protein